MTTERDTESGRISSFERGGLVFDVADRGPLDGEAVILLHGFPQTSRSWDALAPLLHASGHRTLAPDQRGYSPRARPRGRFAYRMSELTADVLALIKAAGLGGRKVHVVGHDWGAAVAWALAASRPDAVATVTALSVPHPAAFMRAMVTSRQLLMSWYMFAFQIPWLPEAVLRRLGRDSRSRLIAGLVAGGQSEAGAARDVDFMMTPGALTPALNWYRAMPFAPPGGLARVSVPSLYVWSDGDPALSRKGAELNRRYMSGPYEFHALPGIGHWIPEQVPEKVADLLRTHLAR
ncbi:alpha/beta fold hydrolase [Actinomadura rupiterrae]|uniref:alpha/beta fold hydrolase n=1 Tax=Actinomadura rupiterrae TaxID=559627 RepID=UPI0020A25494|nr:alpha/beta fold hydrolase [Actinomadura rupiterrae]MCP2342783.1 pimeloyl-ACP methyl ester carboxylesterase [Actinomadura rupiterrae]